MLRFAGGEWINSVSHFDAVTYSLVRHPPVRAVVNDEWGVMWCDRDRRSPAGHLAAHWFGGGLDRRDPEHHWGTRRFKRYSQTRNTNSRLAGVGLQPWTQWVPDGVGAEMWMG